MDLKKIKANICFAISNLPMKRQIRWRFVKWAGVEMADDHSLIGENVTFDRVYPQNIHLGKRVHITNGVVILTHYLVVEGQGVNWRSGHVYIGDDTFIGTNTIISKDVRIGNNCIIGAGSVVTKDIPDNEVWAGNPARFIKKRF